MKIWLITGAQSGLGKTTLTRALADILPGAVHVKIGQGMRKVAGATNFFTETDEAVKFIKGLDKSVQHCLIESNRLAGNIKTDISIFLDTVDGNRRPDATLLRSNANIILDGKAAEAGWQKGLARAGLDSETASRVMDVLREQDAYLAGTRMMLRTKLWFSRDGLVVFGEGLSRLLRGIEEYGSLTAAAKREGISYRHAWGDIKRAEERLGFPLVDSTPGGSEGGGSVLTEKGKLLLEGYEELKHKVIRSSDRDFKRLLEKLEGMS